MINLTRRELLRWVALGVVGTVAAACQPKVVEKVVEKTILVEKERVVKEVVKETVVVAGTPKVEEKIVEKVITNTPAPKGPVQITFVECWFGIPQFQEVVDPVAEAISQKMQEEGLNIALRCQILDDHANKYPVLYASGADFTMAFDAPWYKMPSLRDQGYLLPIENLINDHGPNIKKLVTEEILNANIEFGHNYGIPAYFYYGQTTGVILRYDLLKKYGAPEPDLEVGWPSLEPFLKVIKEKEPDMLPFANASYGIAMNGNGWPNTCWNPGNALESRKRVARLRYP